MDLDQLTYQEQEDLIASIKLEIREREGRILYLKQLQRAKRIPVKKPDIIEVPRGIDPTKYEFPVKVKCSECGNKFKEAWVEDYTDNKYCGNCLQRMIIVKDYMLGVSHK